MSGPSRAAGPHPHDGLLIVLEGIDGGGKTTLQRALADELVSRGHEVVLTKEPTDGPFGRRIRELARDGRHAVSADEEFELFHQDRAEHIARVVRPALERGAIVIQDRSWYSSLAYQGDRGVDRARIEAASRAIAPEPDVLLVVDLPAEVALERIHQVRRTALDDFETLESLRRIRRFFLELPEKTLIDGSRPPAAVLSGALASVSERLGRKLAHGRGRVP